MSRGGAQFNEDQILEFQEAFLLYDNRGDGKIPVAMIGDVMRALGQNPTESDVKKLVHEHRADDRVSFETFLPILAAIFARRSTDTTDDFVEGLRHFDKDGNGFISSAELRHLLTTLGEKLNDEEVSLDQKFLQRMESVPQTLSVSGGATVGWPRGLSRQHQLRGICQDRHEWIVWDRVRQYLSQHFSFPPPDLVMYVASHRQRR